MATKKIQKGSSKKPLIKAQYGQINGVSTTKKNIFGRTKVTTPDTGTWRDGSTSKSVSTKTYDSKGNYLKNKSKSTSTYPDGDKKTMIVKNKAGQGNPSMIRRGITPVQKTGGTTKMKKYAMGGSALRPATDKANRGMYKMGGMKKPLRKKQSGGNSGPLTESDSNELDSMYPSSSRVRIPAAPKNYNEDSEIWGYGGKNDPVDYEMQKRMGMEEGIRSSPDFNNGSVYKKGGMTKKYKTGGMVNANTKITAAKKATGKVGGITKAISKVAVKSASPKGKVGGTSTAPKKASPVKLAKAKMGGAKGKC